MDDIAVVGIGCNFPGGEGLDNFWKVLVEGKNCAVEIPSERFDCSHWYDSDDNKIGKVRTSKAALIDKLNEFDHRFFGITDAEATDMDPQQKLLLQCSYRALEDAGIPMEKAGGTRTGVFIGLMNRDHEMSGGAMNPNRVDHWTGTGVAMSIAANRISYIFNFTGPSMTVDSACSSSLLATHLACQAIMQGDCEMALCGGVSALFEPIVFVALSKAKMISPEGTSKPFSSRADGYGRGEGCGVLLLKPLKKALRDFDHIWGVISKTAVNQDGHSVSPMTKPSMIQQEELLSRVYSTKSDLASVQYIEAHGTGTPVGDPVEAGSISNVIAKSRQIESGPLIIGSVKSNIGHTESAAGVAGLIKVLLMMKHETIVPSVFYDEKSSSIDAKSLNLKIPTKVEAWKDTGKVGRVAGINNFGFGGTNAHAVVKQYKRVCSPKSENLRQRHEYFVLSAASEKSLTMMMEDMVEQINMGSTDDLTMLAYTSACRRTHLKNRYRAQFRVSTLTDLKKQLKSSLGTNLVASAANPRLVFVFCGNGVTYKGMCRQLLKQEPVFREKVQEIETIYQRYKPFRMIEALENDTENGVDFSRPDFIQPLLFAIQVAIYALLSDSGVKADAILGHSVGEVAAAHCSGLLSLEDAVKVIHYRSTLQTKVTGGKMLVVSNMAVSEVLKIIQPYSGKVCLAAHNSSQSCTVSGEADAISSLYQALSNRQNGNNLFLHVLDVAAAYHSHKMDPILSEIEQYIGDLTENETVAELYSTVSGNIRSANDFYSGAYWSRNIRNPVLFEKTLRSAAKDKNVVFVEIGPRRALQRNIIETLGSSTVVLSSVLPNKDCETALSVVGKLFELGVHIDWAEYYKGCEGPPCPLPRYHFEDEKKPLPSAYSKRQTESRHPVLSPSSGDGSDFSCDLSSAAVSYLQHHKNNNVAIVPGAFHVDLGLSSFLAHTNPKVPLNTLQLSIRFESPFLLTKNPPEMKIKLDPGEQETKFRTCSKTITYASGIIECNEGRLAVEPRISVQDLYKRCNSTFSSDDYYKSSGLKGFQYTSVFKNRGDINYGEEYREALASVTVPEELLPQLHDYCIHPVILDYALQLAPVTVARGFARLTTRPGFPASIGGLTVFEPLQKNMIIYLKAVVVGDNHIDLCGCFASLDGKILVEIEHMVMKYLGSNSQIVEELFYHSEFTVTSEIPKPLQIGKVLIFADTLGITRALQKHLSPGSVSIPYEYANDLLRFGLKGILSKFGISDIRKEFQEILFIWSDLDLTSANVDDTLEHLVVCCELFRHIVLELKAINYSHSFRTVTYQSAEGTVNHVSPGFVLTGMSRACAAEATDIRFQLVDLGSVSAEDIQALAQILTSYPCVKYAELVVKDGKILHPQILHSSPLSRGVIDGCENNVKAVEVDLQSTHPYKMSGLTALSSDRKTNEMHTKGVKVKLSKICVHTSDYFPVSVSQLKHGDTVYWCTQAQQSHNLLALDFSGKVTDVGKHVSKLKVGDHVSVCYPISASLEVVVPEGSCYRTKKVHILREVPSVSYFVVAWAIVHHALPRVKQSKKMAVFSSSPDSCLRKVLTLTAKQSGWHSVTHKKLGGNNPNVSNFDAVVILPPFDKVLLEELCQNSSVKYIVAVSEKELPPHASRNVLTREKDSFHLQTLLMPSILEQGFLKTNSRSIYKWLKSMNMALQSLNLSAVTFQAQSPGKLDIQASEHVQSYLTCETVSVIALQSDSTRITPSDITQIPKVHQFFQKNCVYIVVGGLTGLGYETVKFIALRGGGPVVILSRRSPTPDMQQSIDALKQQADAVIVTVQCDVAVTTSVQNAVKSIEHQFPSCPIKGVFHSAVVLDDGLIETLSKSRYEKVLKPKVNGVLNLHHATKHCKLDYFTCYSSVSAFFGNASQTNYAAANSFLDIFCHYRRNLGLAAQSINYGALNLGLLENKDHFQRFLESKGMAIMNLEEIHGSLEESFLLNKPQQVVCKFNYKNMYQNVVSRNSSLTQRISSLIEEGLRKANLLSLPTEPTVAPSSPDEYIKSVLSETINVHLNELSDDSLLAALGIDSMLAMTLQNLIYQGSGVTVPLVKLLDPNSTVATLVGFLDQDDKTGSGSTDEVSTAL
ncbi:uncharacterized protein LOC134455103 [Engraulis encrasicolus]|uniref:uncharacterized protein LOC134455103 n=1 Tax=Engraulis encrasicolus TaxID=184585 RepID=UPI002FD20A98